MKNKFFAAFALCVVLSLSAFADGEIHDTRFGEIHDTRYGEIHDTLNRTETNTADENSDSSSNFFSTILDEILKVI